MAERDAKGRFAKGNKASPGRSPRAVENRYMEAFLSAVSTDDMVKIVRVAVAQAINGDKDARKCIVPYVLGIPKQSIELTGLDGGALTNEIIIRYADNNFAETSSVADAGEEGEETI